MLNQLDIVLLLSVLQNAVSLVQCKTEHVRVEPRFSALNMTLADR